jgi:hypothetical protein
LAAAKASGVKVIRQGDALILEATPKLPPDVVALLKAAKPDLLCILTGREAAKGTLDAKAPAVALGQGPARTLRQPSARSWEGRWMAVGQRPKRQPVSVGDAEKPQPTIPDSITQIKI